MPGQTARIKTSQQVRIVELMLALGKSAESHTDYQQLYELSELASLLEGHADETDVTLFFDLGELLYERAQELKSPRPPDPLQWQEDLLGRVHTSLAIARQILRDDHHGPRASS